MRPVTSSRQATLVFTCLLAAAITSPLWSADLYWDGTDTTADADGGTGTWDTTATNWDDAATAGNATAWTNGDNAIFGAAAGTVTVSGSLQTPSMVIQSGYTFTGGAPDSIDVGGGTIDSSSLGTGGATDVVMNAVLTGTGGLTINAHGNTSPSGGGSGAEFRLGNGNGNGNSFSGGLDITGGMVSWTDDSSFGNAANTITLKNFGGLLATSSTALGRDIIIDPSGGTIRTYGSATLTLNGQISGSGDLNRTDGGTLILTNSANAQSGTWNLQAGILRLNGGGSLGTATINNGTRLDFFNDATAPTYANTITGGGGIRFESATGTTFSGTINNTANIQVGDVTNNASLTIATGASITTTGIWVGESGGVAGHVTQQAGTAVTINKQMRIGHWSNNTSTYTMDGGTLTLTGTPGALYETDGIVILGIDGTGIFNHNNGTVTASGVGLDLRGNTAGTDQYNLNGGTLILGAAGIGGNASSEFNLGGGTLRASAGFASTKDWNVNANSTLDVDGNTVTMQGNITGSADLALSGATGSLILDNAGAQSVSANLTGVGALTKTGTGTLTLSGTNTYTGATNIDAGGLQLTGSLGNTAVAIADGTTLSGEGSIGGGLALGSSAGAGLAINPNTPGSLDVTGAVTLTGANALTFSEAPAPTGSPIRVLSHGGLTGTLGTDLVLDGAANYRSATWSDSAGIVSIDIGNKALVWNGTSGGEWDLKTSSRWNTGEADVFAWADAVTFDDTGATTAITLTGDLRPSQVTVDSDTNNYSFAGAAIGGQGALVKDGTSTLTINTANTFTGDVTVNGGTIVIGNKNALGAYRTGRPADQVSVAAGAAVDLNGVADATYGYTITGTGVGGTGVLTNTGGAIGTGSAQTSNITLAGDASIGGTGDWALLTNGYGPTTLDLDGNTLTKTGTNTFTLANSTVTAGAIQVDSGKLRVFRTSNASAASISLADAAGVDLILNQNLSAGSLSGGGSSGGNLILNSSTLTFGALNSSDSFGGTISGPGNLIKNGTGIQTFSGNLTNPGTLTINGGGVTLSGSATFSRTISPNSGMPTRAIQGGGTLRTEAGADITLRRSGDGFTGAVQVAGGTLTLGQAGATGSASVNLEGGTLAFDNSGSYFTPIAGKVLVSDADPGTNDEPTTDATTTDYGTLHNNSGDVVPGNTTHAYTGRIYLTAGDWGFSKRFDDGGSVTIDGTTIINNEGWQDTVTATFNADADGWYDIDVRVYQGAGGVGPAGGWPGIGIKQGAATANAADYTAYQDGVLGTRLVTDNDVTFSRPIAVDSNSTIDTSAMVGTPGDPGTDGNGTNGDLNLTGSLSGTADLTKTGSGTLNLNANNSAFTGHLVVDGGTARINNQIRGAAGFTVNAGATLETNATNIFVPNHGTPLADSQVITADGGTLLMTSQMNARFGNVTLSNGGTWTSNRGLGSYDALLADTDAGAATITVNGSGTSVMDGTGGIHLQGVQNFDIADTTGDDAADLSVSMTLASQGAIGGPAGGINKTGAGTMAISTRATYTGGTTVNGGVLDLTGGGGSGGTIRGTATVNTGATLRLSTGDATGYGTGPDRLGVINLNSGTMVVNTTANQTLGNAVINLTGGSITGVAGSNLDFFQGSSALNSLASANTSTVGGTRLSIRQASGLTIDVADGGAATDLRIDSVIRNNGSFSSAPLIKSGDGTLLLTGANTHTGDTDIQGGTLALGATASIADSANIIVGASSTFDVSAVSGGFSLAAGQTISGAGTVSGGTTITGSLAPGNSIGTLSFGSDLTLAGTSDFEIDSGAETADLAIVAAALIFGGDLNVTNIGGTLAQGQSFDLFDFDNGQSSGAFASVNLPDPGAGLGWDDSALYTTGTIVVIPETSAALLAALGALGLLVRRR